MTKWKKSAIQLSNEIEKEPVPIVSDAAVAIKDLAEGRIIPLFIIDTSQRPDIEDMIRSHKHFGPGDVESVWSISSKFDKSKICLVLTITKPSRCVVILEFDVARQGGVIDQIIQAQGLYLQPGKKGDRLSSTMDNERLLVEIPTKAFRKEWDKIIWKTLNKDFRRRGLSKNEASQATENFLREWRQFGAARMWKA